MEPSPEIPSHIAIPFKLVLIGSTRRLVLDDTTLDKETVQNLHKILYLPMNPVPNEVLSAVRYKTYESFVNLLEDVPNVDFGEYFTGLGFSITTKERIEHAPKQLEAFLTAFWSRDVRRTFEQKKDPFKNLTGACSAPKACDCYTCTDL